MTHTVNIYKAAALLCNCIFFSTHTVVVSHCH